MSEYKIKAYNDLVKCCGYWQNGSQNVVTISQDDATFEFVVKVGKSTHTHRDLSVALSSAAQCVEE